MPASNERTKFVQKRTREDLYISTRLPSWKRKRVVELLCSTNTSDFGRSILTALKNCDYAYVCGTKINPADYADSSSHEFAADWLSAGLFSKYLDFAGTADPRIIANKKWLSSEAACRDTNDIFRMYWDGKFLFPPRVDAVLHGARRKIRSILQGFDRIAFVEKCRFGPGSDLSTVRNNTSWYDKYSRTGTITPSAFDRATDLFRYDRRLCDMDCKFVSHSELFYVPKRFDEFRTAVKEPRWNQFFQLGLGSCIEDRLRSNGLCIKTQADRNRYLSSKAHVLGLATIDLSSASDMCSTNLVIDLLTGLDSDEEEHLFSDWLDLLLAFRSTYCVFEKRLVRLEKISSMGNGFTFPLETLIFYSIAFSCCKAVGVDTSMIGVFGDDIIVPQPAAPLLLESLKAFGFLPNPRKTFISGEFFESCGTDWFRGRDVRPFFVEKLDTYLDLVRLCNRIFDYSRRRSPFQNGIDASLFPLWLSVLEQIPKPLRLYGSRLHGDSCINVTSDLAQLSPFGDGLEGYRGYVYEPVLERPIGRSYYGHLYSKLSGVNGTGDRVSRRDTNPRYRRSKKMRLHVFPDDIWDTPCLDLDRSI